MQPNLCAGASGAIPPCISTQCTKVYALHLTSHLYFPFFHLSSLLPLPFLNVMQPFLPFFLLFSFSFFSLHSAECRNKSNQPEGQSRRVCRVCRACNAAQGTGADEGRAVGHTAHTVINCSLIGRALQIPDTAGTGWI